MFVNEVRNVNFALAGGLSTLLQHGVEQSSRNGPVIVAPAPVTTVTHRPDERVLSLPGRNENPFFHFVESLWMLAGRNDLAALTPYVSRMAQFSDDGGKTQPGAYGHRWRRHFDRDQLAWAIQRLRKDPNDRRVGHWDVGSEGRHRRGRRGRPGRALQHARVPRGDPRPGQHDYLLSLQ